MSNRAPAAAYVAPFAAFMLLLAVGSHLGLGDRGEAAVRVLVPLAVLLAVSRGVLSFRITHLPGSIALGVAVFLLWIGPDVLMPGWHRHGLFSNRFTGTVSTAAPAGHSDPVWLALRVFRAAVLVPIVEELFWRGWLPRWVDHPDDFQRSALGTFSRMAFWVTAVLFASEHGVMWDVGLMAGVLYNWWMFRTRSLGDLILTHAVTNACLSAYVICQGRWEYW